jgi:CAI-1 autoinducer synthase
MSTMTTTTTTTATPRRGELPSLTARLDEFDGRFPDELPTQGRPPEPGCVLLHSNDYLSLSADPRIVGAQVEALMTAGREVMMSSVYLAEGGPQRRFERDLARFLDAEDVVLCQSGFAANDSLVQILCDPEVPAYIDRFAHASLWQGAQSARAPTHPFVHNDLQHLGRLIAENGPGVVVVDAVYSTLGDLCPLEELVPLCEARGCLLVVDESHSMGVIGERGEGLTATLGLTARVPYRTFSLSKAMVGRGGIIAGPTRVLRHLRCEARPAVFSSAVLEHDVARFAATLRVVQGAGDRRRRLQASAARLREGLSALGYDVSPSRTQIIPLVAGPVPRTVALRKALERHGVIGAVFLEPATPRNGSLVRLSVTSGTTDAELDQVLAACAAIRDEVRPEEWRRPRVPVRGG